MGWFLISRHALGQFAKLLLEVSVYECGCSLRFVSVGSNIVCTSMALPAKGSLIFNLTWRWPYQNPKEAKKPNGNLLDLVV